MFCKSAVYEHNDNASQLLPNQYNTTKSRKLYGKIYSVLVIIRFFSIFAFPKEEEAVAIDSQCWWSQKLDCPPWMTAPENKTIDCWPGLLKRQAPSGRNTAEVDGVTVGVHSLEMFASTFDIIMHLLFCARLRWL